MIGGSEGGAEWSVMMPSGAGHTKVPRDRSSGTGTVHTALQLLLVCVVLQRYMHAMHEMGKGSGTARAETEQRGGARQLGQPLSPFAGSCATQCAPGSRP